MENAIRDFLTNYPSVDEIQIQNASDTNGGIPACLCYVRAGEKMKFKVYVNKKLIHEDFCTKLSDPRVWMTFGERKSLRF